MQIWKSPGVIKSTALVLACRLFSVVCQPAEMGYGLRWVVNISGEQVNVSARFFWEYVLLLHVMNITIFHHYICVGNVTKPSNSVSRF